MPLAYEEARLGNTAKRLTAATKKRAELERKAIAADRKLRENPTKGAYRSYCSVASRRQKAECQEAYFRYQLEAAERAVAKALHRETRKRSLGKTSSKAKSKAKSKTRSKSKSKPIAKKTGARYMIKKGKRWVFASEATYRSHRGQKRKL